MKQCKLARMPRAQIEISVSDLTEAISVQSVTIPTTRRKEYASMLNLVFDTFLIFVNRVSAWRSYLFCGDCNDKEFNAPTLREGRETAKATCQAPKSSLHVYMNYT